MHGEMAVGRQCWSAEAAEMLPLHPPASSKAHPAGTCPGPTGQQRMLGTVSALAGGTGTARAPAALREVSQSFKQPGGQHTPEHYVSPSQDGETKIKGFPCYWPAKVRLLPPVAPADAAGKARTTGPSAGLNRDTRQQTGRGTAGRDTSCPHGHTQQKLM